MWVFCVYRAFIVSLGNDNTVRILRIGKKEDGSPGNITAALDFPKVSCARLFTYVSSRYCRWTSTLGF